MKRIFLALAFLALTVVPAFAVSPVWVDDSWAGHSGGDPVDGHIFGTDAFATIQNGIDAVDPGGIVNVYPGTYNQDQANGRNPDTGGAGANDFNIFVGKAATIRGVDAGGVPVSSYGAVGAYIQAQRNLPTFGTSAIYVAADNVTITGFDVTGYEAGNNKTLEVCGDNFAIKYCKLHALDDTSCLYLTDRHFNPAGSGTSHVQSYRIEANLVDGGGPDASGIRISSGPGWSGDVAFRVITGNTFSNTCDAIAFVGPGADEWDVYPVGDATITSNTFGLSDRRHVIAWGQYLGGLGYINLDWAGIIANNTFDKGAMTWNGADARYWDMPSYGFYYVRGLYSGISRYALAKAQPGDRVQVLAGTYEEQLEIAQNLTLEGAGRSATKIQSPAALTKYFSTGPNNYPVIYIHDAANVAVKNLTVDGMGRGNANVRFLGVAFWNAGGQLLGTDVKRIEDTPFSGVQHGVGVYCNNSGGGPYTFEMGDVNITDFQKNGTVFAGSNLTVNVHGCTVVGKGATGVTAQNGIQLGYGAGGTIDGCKIQDVWYTGSGWAATGLLLYQQSAVTVLNMSAPFGIYNCLNPVYSNDGPVDLFDVAVDNHASVGAGWGMILYNSSSSLAKPTHPAVRPPSIMSEPNAQVTPSRASYAVNITGGCLLGNDVSGTAGIFAWSEGGPLSVNVSGTLIKDWEEGLVPYGANVTLTANYNRIVSNTYAGYDNTACGQVQDIEHNWWGATDGPTFNGSGHGDAVYDVTPQKVDFNPWMILGNSDCGTALVDNTIAPAPPGECISTANPCVTVPVNITRADNTPMRGYSVTFTLNSKLALCTDLTHSVTQGSYLSGTTNFQAVDNHDGSYTVDCAILGLPCGATGAGGTLFNTALKNSGSDGTGVITVTSVILRDCNNAPIPGVPGAPGSITIDNTLPVAVSALTAVQVKAGNDTSGRTAIHLTFTAPGDAAVTKVYRAPYGIDSTGAYPEYDDHGGAGAPVASPTYPPGSAWTLTGVTATGDNDTPPARGFWYYVAYVKDACGNWSAVSNQTGGTLDYHLGDVSNGVTAGAGDNAVDIADISLLGAHYGISLSYPDTLDYLDVGPTGNYSVDALPTTDNRVNFEDLMMFAMNYELVGLAGGSSAGEVAAGQKSQEHPALALVADPAAQPGIYAARLYLRDNTTSVKGIHAVIAYDPAKAVLLGVTQGRLLSGANIFFKQVGDNAGLVVDAAALGQGSTIAGSGEVAVLRFRMIGTSAAPVLSRSDLRDRDNAFLGQAPDGAVRHAADPTTIIPEGGVALLGARPNPFGGTTEIQFRLPAETRVRLHIFDVSGRLVRTLTDRVMPAGTQSLIWDGRDDSGQRTGVGVYLCTFQAGDSRTSLKLYRYR